MKKKCLILLTLMVALPVTQAETQSMNRKVNIASLCLLEGEQYSNKRYVFEALNDVETSSNLQIVITPFMPFLQFSEADALADLKDFSDWAKSRDSILVVAMKELAVSGQTYHTSVIIGRDGEIAGKYRKSHKVAHDGDGFALGNELPVFEVDGVKIGLTLTSDFYFFEVYTVLWMKGADLFVWQHYPEMLRDHSAWRFLLHNRAKDYNRHLVTAMYADEGSYLTSHRVLSMKGSPWGRSMIVAPSGVVRADTAYYDGVASLTVDLDQSKKVFEPGQTSAVFTVPNKGDRKAFALIAEAWEKPKLPEYEKRTARIVVTGRMMGKNWRDDEYPESVFNLLKKAEKLNPDFVVFSEEFAKVNNPTTKKAMDEVGQWANKNNCYVMFGGLRDDNGLSIAWVWNRQGEIIFDQPVYWNRGIEQIDVFDTDFARFGIRVCGDVFIPEMDRVLALKGAEIILDPSLMWGPDGYFNEMSARTRAIDNDVYVACAHFHSSDFNLRSFILDPYGSVLTATQHGEEELAYVDIDFSKKRIYYSAESTQTEFVYEKNYGHYRGQVPDEARGWRDMLFENRRPELYGIIPTQNEITRATFMSE